MRAFDEYIFVSPGSDYNNTAMNELRAEPCCTFFDYVLDNRCSKFIKKLHHVHYSFTLNKYFNLPLQCIWHSKYVIKEGHFEKEKQYCLVFFDISACRVDEGYLNELHSVPNVTMVLVHANLVSTKERMLKNRYKYFSIIFSFDKGDCERYNFYHYTTFYSKLPLITPQKQDSDAFFVGVSKDGRHEKLVKLYRRLSDANAKSDFYIAHHLDTRNREKGIHYNKWLSYEDVLQKVLKSNCLIEIVGKNHQGFTLRTIEALCYNKRLVTNNAVVKDLKYYKTGYILYTPNIEDADISFITSKESVEYNYENEYSPLRLLDTIDSIVINK